MRALIVALFVVNLGFAAWAAGWLGAAGNERDPGRLARQVNPDRVRVARQPVSPPRSTAPATAPADAAPKGTLAPADVTRAPGATGSVAPLNPATLIATAPTAAGTTQPASPSDPNCFEIGPFTPAEVVAAETALVRASLPAGSWIDLKVDRPGEYIVYAGRYPDREGLERKIAELRRLRVQYEEIRDLPDLQPGLAIGRFSERADAEAAQAQLQQLNVRNTRVIAIAAPTTTHLLRVERADAALQAQLAGLRAPALGAGFVRCGLAAAATPGR
jgi:hypothetical protein